MSCIVKKAGILNDGQETAPRFGMRTVNVQSLLLVSALLIGAGVPLQADVDVTPSSMGSWSFAFNAGGPDYLPCVSCQNGSMVTGPGTPPLGVGSAMLQTTAGNGDGASSIATSSLNGIAAGDLTSLSYSTYDTTNNGQQFPYLQINISYTNDINNDGPGTDTLFFEPPYQTASAGNPNLVDQGATVMSKWQTWDAVDSGNALEGGWWDNNGFANPAAGATGGVETYADILSNFTDPIIVANVPYFPNDGLALTVGFASSTDNFLGYVDNVTIGTTVGGTTTYDFEPNPTSAPETSSIMTLVTMLLAGGLGLKLRKPAARS